MAATMSCVAVVTGRRLVGDVMRDQAARRDVRREAKREARRVIARWTMDQRESAGDAAADRAAHDELERADDELFRDVGDAAQGGGWTPPPP
jgi:hypothetical protein